MTYHAKHDQYIPASPITNKSLNRTYDNIFQFLQPLGLEKEKVFMISDSLSSSSAQRL